MRLLLKAAIQSKKHLCLLFITLLAMFTLTIATKLEMFSLGVIAKSGPDFFTLFGEKAGETLQTTDQVSLGTVQDRWQEIVPSGGPIDSQSANAYVAKHRGGNAVTMVVAYLDDHLQISTNLLRLALVIIVIAVFKAVSLFSHRYFTQLVAIRVSRDLRQKYFEHIQSLPMSFYHEHNIGSLASRVAGDAGVVAGAINSWLINYLQTPFSIISTLGICFWISWKLSLVVFIGFPAILFPMIYFARKIKMVSKQIQRNQENFGSVLIDYLSGIFTIKVFAMEKFSLRKYCDENNRWAKLEEKSARYGLAARPILHMVSSLLFAGVILYGIYVIQMGVADLLVFCALLYAFYEPIKKLAEENNNIQRGVAAAERMYEVLNLKPQIVDHPEAVPLEGFKQKIEFDNVTFGYGNEPVLRNLSFTVNKGETVALVGPTGSGKSTIVKLLPRLYDLQKGEIRIDGKPLTAFTQNSLREQISFVPQKPFLFIDSVEENISFGRSFSDKAVLMAAKRAHAHEFIVQLPGAYKAPVTEGGKNLSGGQQQRLAIARALVKDAPILVLDEATSSLDAVSEEKIKEAIMGLHGEITQIIIAHRFSTIEHADRIIYLDHGEKIAEGTRDELLESCPEFRLMYQTLYKESAAKERV